MEKNNGIIYKPLSVEEFADIKTWTHSGLYIYRLIATIEAAWTEIEKLQKWVNDLQSGMYVNCVYCGHRYGPNDKVLVSMAEVLKQHIEKCPEHPMSKLKAEKEIYKKHWIDLCNKILSELDKDGWCRLVMTKEEALKMKRLLE